MLAIGNANARLGWTFEQCQNAWGAPIDTLPSSSADEIGYNFSVQPNFFAQVHLLLGVVESVEYCSTNKQFLLDNVHQLLQKNHSGYWHPYDDRHGRMTSKSWKVDNQYGDGMAYALFFSNPDNRGFYHLQVSSVAWDTYLMGLNERDNAKTNKGAPPPPPPPVTNNGDSLNV